MRLRDMIEDTKWEKNHLKHIKKNLWKKGKKATEEQIKEKNEKRKDIRFGKSGLSKDEIAEIMHIKQNPNY